MQIRSATEWSRLSGTAVNFALWSCLWCLPTFGENFLLPSSGYLFFVAQQSYSVLGSLMFKVFRLHTDTPHSVGLLWTRDRPVAETSTWQHTTFTTDKHPCPLRDSNPPSQQVNGRRPAPSTARPPESASSWYVLITYHTTQHNPEDHNLNFVHSVRPNPDIAVSYVWRSLSSNCIRTDTLSCVTGTLVLCMRIVLQLADIMATKVLWGQGHRIL